MEQITDFTLDDEQARQAMSFKDAHIHPMEEGATVVSNFSYTFRDMGIYTAAKITCLRCNKSRELFNPNVYP